MDRLTPWLRRRTLALPLADRLALIEALRGSIVAGYETRDQRLHQLAAKMQAISGQDVRTNRKPAAVNARYVFSLIATQEGFTQSEIGRFLGRDHSTVHYMLGQMGRAFELPHQYPDTIALYNQFVNAISK